jgi:hypothetical protein
LYFEVKETSNFPSATAEVMEVAIRKSQTGGLRGTIMING